MPYRVIIDNWNTREVAERVADNLRIDGHTQVSVEETLDAEDFAEFISALIQEDEKPKGAPLHFRLPKVEASND